MHSLRSRLALLVAVALAPGFVLLWLASRAERAVLLRAAEDEVVELAERAAEQQERTVDAARGVLATLSQTRAVVDADPAACERIARGLLASMPELANVGAADTRGRLVCSAVALPGAVDVSDRRWFRDALATGRFAAGDSVTSRLRGVASIHFGLGFRAADGAMGGVVFVSVNASQIAAQLATLPLPASHDVYVTDAAGVVLAGTGLAPGSLLPEPLRAPELGQPPAVRVQEGADGVRRVYAFEDVPGVDGGPAMRVVVGVPAALAYGTVDELTRRMLLVYGAAGLVLLVAVVAAGHLLLARRLERISAAARRLNEGDFSARTGVSDTSELGELGRAFDELASGLERLTRQHRLVLESAGDGIVGLDPQRRITFANPAAEQLLGVAPGQALGRPVHDFLPDRAPDGCPACAALDGGSARRAGEVRVVREDGSALTAECVATPALDRGAIVGAVVTLKDVRERRRLEEDLRQAQKMEAVGQLAGGVAHDFNNLLTAILGAGQFAREALAGHPARADVEDMLGAARRGADLTRRLLAFSRRQVAELRVVDVRQVVTAVQELLRRLLPEDVALTTRVAPERCLVRADRGLLEQALVNLAVNARDAMPSGGRLVIEARTLGPDAPERRDDPGLPEGGVVLISVRDTGVGMDEATRARIFEPFFTTKEAGRGTGLGLSTVYGAVRQSGGVVRVESAPGAGTTFRLLLPRVLDDAAPTPAPPRRPSAGSERVLLVEDDAVVRALARRALDAGGYQVVEADRPTAARAALEASRVERLDLLVTDVMLPESSGAALADELGARFPGMRVLFMSGYTAGRLADGAADAPGRAFLSKPFGPDALVARVRELLDAPV